MVVRQSAGAAPRRGTVGTGARSVPHNCEGEPNQVSDTCYSLGHNRSLGGARLGLRGLLVIMRAGGTRSLNVISETRCVPHQ